ncbi:MAG: HP0268 family nuclease [Campylobacterota bacterium]|nr:HP0268 family nuclease [Campylobacterota bacterium]
MDLKFARTDINEKAKKVDLIKIETAVEKDDSIIFYFDRDNSHKDLLSLQDHFEAKGKSFYMSEVKFGLSDNDYMYQVHIMS